jgi:hypothetical protein
VLFAGHWQQQWHSASLQHSVSAPFVQLKYVLRASGKTMCSVLLLQTTKRRLACWHTLSATYTAGQQTGMTLHF